MPKLSFHFNTLKYAYEIYFKDILSKLIDPNIVSKLIDFANKDFNSNVITKQLKPHFNGIKVPIEKYNNQVK